MNLTQLLLALRARYKIALLVLVTTVAAAVAVSLQLPQKYTATATIIVDVRSPDPVLGMMLPALMMQKSGYMATQVDIIQSPRVAQAVVKGLRLDQSPTIREKWMLATQGQVGLTEWVARVLKEDLKVEPSRESNIITIQYTALDAKFAATVANAFAQAFIEATIELKVEPAKEYSVWFTQQSKLLRDNLERAQTQLSEHQQKYGIVASDERFDTETAKLNDLSTQLTIVQGQATDARSKQRSGSAADALPEVAGSPVISSLRREIALQEAKLQQLAGNLGRNHPQYQRTEAEIAELKQQLEAETRYIMSGFSASRAVGRERAAQLMAEIVAQKKKLLTLKGQRDQLAVLMRDVDAAQKAYDAVSQKLNQVTLESQATQTNVSLLTPASTPIKPSSPKTVLNTLIAIVLGTALGIGAALALELNDRRIRSAQDLVAMLQLPVLGVIGTAKGRRSLALGYHQPALAANRQLDFDV